GASQPSGGTSATARWPAVRLRQNVATSGAPGSRHAMPITAMVSRSGSGAGRRGAAAGVRAAGVSCATACGGWGVLCGVVATVEGVTVRAGAPSDRGGAVAEPYAVAGAPDG